MPSCTRYAASDAAILANATAYAPVLQLSANPVAGLSFPVQTAKILPGSPDLRSHHARRSLMMSATRKALAMMVSVGLTAPMDGKKLASVT